MRYTVQARLERYSARILQKNGAILGYLHVIVDNSQNTEQLEEKFYPK